MTWIDTLREWQTLAAGILAIAGGAFVVAQTAEMRGQEKARWKRRHTAARAVMPLALSTLCEYASNCVKVLAKIEKYGTKSGGLPTRSDYPDFPAAPSEIIAAFSNVIESAPPQVSEAFAQVLRDLQVNNSRLRSLSVDLSSNSSVVTLNNLYHNVADGLELYASSEALFDYARGKSRTAPQSLEASRVLNVLNIVDIHSPSEDLVAIIRGRSARREAEIKHRRFSSHLAEALRKIRRLGGPDRQNSAP